MSGSSPDTPYYGVGTPYYMAPEQVQDSEHVGPAADIWAFGVVAYECLTGRRPYDEASIGQLLVRLLSPAPPPPASTLAPVPSLFDDWFRVACARHPDQRFPDIQTAAAELAFALDTAVLVAPPAPAKPKAPSHRQASPMATSMAPRSGERVATGDAPASQRATAPIPPRGVSPAPAPPRTPSSPPPLAHRGLPALGALAAAVLAVAVAVRDDPSHHVAHVVIAHASLREPAPLPIDQVAIPQRPLTSDEATAPPLSPSSVPAPDPPAAPTATPRSAPRRQRPSEATPSVFRLPPLGL